eukprot:4933943-Amphidinium_carterae.6
MFILIYVGDLLIIGEESEVNAFIANTSTVRPAMGKLQWMAAVRPDIQYASKELGRKLSAPTSKDESATKHLIKYLRGTQNLVLRMAPEEQVTALHFMSTVAQIGHLWGASIVHYSKTLATVAQSSAEAEKWELSSQLKGSSFTSTRTQPQYLHMQGLLEPSVITMQSSAITVRGMAIKCYSWSVRLQDVVIM